MLFVGKKTLQLSKKIRTNFRSSDIINRNFGVLKWMDPLLVNVNVIKNIYTNFPYVHQNTFRK